MNTLLMSELFGGAQRYRVLAALFEEPGRSFGLRELASATGVDSGNLSRWLKRWVDVGLVERSDTPLPRFKASSDPLLAPLVSLFRQGGELVDDLKKAIGAMKGVSAAAVFGSFARQDTNAQSDIDVLVIGELSELKVNAALKPLSRKHARDFNATVMAAAEFQRLASRADGFVMEILERPIIDLKGSIHEAAKPG